MWKEHFFLFDYFKIYFSHGQLRSELIDYRLGDIYSRQMSDTAFVAISNLEKSF